MDAVAHWCSVDTRTGSLTCVLEENTCFDAEMYADELEVEEKIDFKEDQRSTLDYISDVELIADFYQSIWANGSCDIFLTT